MAGARMRHAAGAHICKRAPVYQPTTTGNSGITLVREATLVRIEPATLDDLPALVTLLSQLFAIEKDFPIDVDRQRRGLEMLIRAPRTRAVLLVARGESPRPIGMASGQLVVSTAEGALSAWIEDVFVSERFRGRGVGRALLHAVLEWAATQGATRAQLLADQSNQSALEFYAGQGWRRGSMVMLRRPVSAPDNPTGGTE
jgi:GNAT superfamily N-acetyltransferase